MLNRPPRLLPRFSKLLLCLALAACGGGGGSHQGIVYRTAPQGILGIFLNGRDITFGGQYIVGACNGEDNFNTNVTSFNAPDGVLISPTNVCPGAPYSFAFKQSGNTLTVDVSVGPLPAQYASLSVPLQFPYVPGDGFTTNVGQDGTYGELAAIGHGQPYQLLVKNASQASVILSNGVTVSITSNFPGVGFIANPPLAAETLEPRWLNLPRGAVLTAHEVVSVN